jgi:hypothetical protein
MRITDERRKHYPPCEERDETGGSNHISKSGRGRLDILMGIHTWKCCSIGLECIWGISLPESAREYVY